MKHLLYALTVSLIASAGCAMAQDKPTSQEARKVIDYYFHGKGKGVVPMEYKFCQKISQKGENKNECVSEIAANAVKKGQEAYIWMNFLVPAGDEAKILLQYSRNEMVRDTSNVSLGGATRYRTWKKIPTSTAGEWKVRLVQEMSDSDLEIGQLKYSVVD